MIKNSIVSSYLPSVNLRAEKEGARARTKLVKQLEDLLPESETTKICYNSMLSTSIG